MVNNTGLNKLFTDKMSSVIQGDVLVFLTQRENYQWRTQELPGKPSLHILTKDLSDSHLSNIINFLKNSVNDHLETYYIMMVNEREYRKFVNIHVPEYKTVELYKEIEEMYKDRFANRRKKASGLGNL